MANVDKKNASIALHRSPFQVPFTSTTWHKTRVLFTPNLRLSSALTNIPQSKCSLIAKTTTCSMFLTYRKGLKRNGKNPVLIYGYGGFNVSLSPNFSSMRIPFLENGGVYVQVNLRGGSEYGEEWHVAGTKMQKQNVFDDFISAAEWLVSNHFTSKEHIAIMGGKQRRFAGRCMYDTASRPLQSVHTASGSYGYAALSQVYYRLELGSRLWNKRG